MNYEALGRYTEATEKAKSKATDVRNALARLGRLTVCPNTGSGAFACEYDFQKIKAVVSEAEQAHVELLVAVAMANHEAVACERPAITLYRQA